MIYALNPRSYTAVNYKNLKISYDVRHVQALYGPEKCENMQPDNSKPQAQLIITVPHPVLDKLIREQYEDAILKQEGARTHLSRENAQQIDVDDGSNELWNEPEVSLWAAVGLHQGSHMDQ